MPARTCLTMLLAAVYGVAGAQAMPRLEAPQPVPRLHAEQLAIVINDAEPNSVAIGEYYRRVRNIPAANVVHVRIPGRPHRLDPPDFARLKASIEGQLGPGIEAVLMLWTAPYAVGCNAITSAFTLGYDAAQCANPCAPGRASAYYNAASARPYTDFKMRLSMLLPIESVAESRALIDRGVASGFRLSPATAYYLQTSQTARNARAPLFPRAGANAARKLRVASLHADALQDVRDIIIYQTGMASVTGLDSLGFLPGALADHLTSFGGDLLASSQMSSLRWLEAGATASYGTVSEPCNYWQKFPHPTVLLKHYSGGSSAIEAYWRSVAWPAQGLFLGEPLAAPYGRN